MGTPWSEIGYLETRQAERGAAAPDAPSGAPPSNRAPGTCTSDESFQVLWQGIDSLELSFGGSTNPDIESCLRGLKEQARSRDPSERASAQYQSLNHIFCVSDRGWGLYPFVLDNDCFRISVASCSSSRIPMASCQIRSEYLAHRGVVAAVADLRVVLTELGMLDGAETVSRADLTVDFVTDVVVADWDRRGWVTRARDIRAYWDDQLFTGWTIGLGSPTAFRMYLKSHEIDTRSHKVYLHELWRAEGWPPGYPVWRGEFQLRREVLAQLSIQTVQDLLEHSPGLWQYLTGDWLRYAVPVLGTKRSDWLTQPLWCALAAVPWQGQGGRLTRVYKPTGVPTDEYFGRMGTGLLSSIMARSGILEPDEGFRLFNEQVKEYCNRLAVMRGISREEVLIEKVREKGRKWFTMNNASSRKITPEQQYFAERAYRRESDGE